MSWVSCSFLVLALEVHGGSDSPAPGDDGAGYTTPRQNSHGTGFPDEREVVYPPDRLKPCNSNLIRGRGPLQVLVSSSITPLSEHRCTTRQYARNSGRFAKRRRWGRRPPSRRNPWPAPYARTVRRGDGDHRMGTRTRSRRRGGDGEFDRARSRIQVLPSTVACCPKASRLRTGKRDTCAANDGKLLDECAASPSRL